jgi:fermentation-respiration switch protein FrsA (DUF1100 family)
MRKVLLAAGAALFVAASWVPALADEVIGAIVSVDFIGGTVTLDNGQTFLLTETVDPVMLELGQQVTIIYEPTLEGLSAVTEIAPII